MIRSYRFGEFRLAPATRELWRGNVPVAVPPRAFDCIVYLVEHRERAVGRDELIAAVWGKTDISDGMLGQTVLSMRRAVDDTGKEQHVVRTVFRFGYHWVAAVEVRDGDVDADATISTHVPIGPHEPMPPEQQPIVVEPEQASEPIASVPDVMRKRRRNRLFATIATVALVGAITWVAAQRQLADTMPKPTRPMTSGPATIALVLPFSVSAAGGSDWMRLGLMDLVAARLRNAGLAMVPSDNTVALMRGHAVDAKSLTQATGAGVVIQTSAEAIGARWRITLRTTWGHEPALIAVGESDDALEATRNAADGLARQLGYAALPEPPASVDASAVAQLSQQIEAAILTDDLSAARALVATLPAAQRELPEFQLRLAQIDYQSGDFDAAESGFRAVAESVPAERDPVLHARALSNLGAIAAQRGNTGLAIRHYDAAIGLLRNEHAVDALGRALLGRAMTLGSNGRHDEALRDFAEARSALDSTGNVLALAVLDANLGALDLLRLRYAEAVPVFERAANRFATFNMHAAELNSRAAVAELKLALLEPDAALVLLPRIRDLMALVADPARQRSGALTCVQILLANGRLHEAGDLLKTTLDSAAQANDSAALAHGHALAAQSALARNDFRRAASEADLALPHFNDADDARERALTLRLRIVALLASGDNQRAAADLQTFAGLADGAAAAPVRMYFHLAEADVSASTGTKGTAEKFKLALAEADALHIPLDLREAVQGYVNWLLGDNGLEQASAAVERLASWSALDYDSALLRLRIQHRLGDATRWRSSLNRVRSIAGERDIPAELTVAPDRD